MNEKIFSFRIFPQYNFKASVNENTNTNAGTFFIIYLSKKNYNKSERGKLKEYHRFPFPFL